MIEVQSIFDEELSCNTLFEAYIKPRSDDTQCTPFKHFHYSVRFQFKGILSVFQFLSIPDF